MVQEIVKLPLTLLEREQLGEEAEIRVPASYEEYLEWADKCPYNLEYYQGEIISMGNASFYHEKLVIRLGILLGRLFLARLTYSILGSNIKIHIPDPLNPSDFNADVSIVDGAPDFLTLPSGKKSTAKILNPKLIVEITSKSTINHDFGEKLLAYKKIESLQQVIFISQYTQLVTVYTRQGPHSWTLQDIDLLTDSVDVLGEKLTLNEMYEGITFE